MKDDDPNPDSANDDSSIPINLREPRPPDETGGLIVRLKPGQTLNHAFDLATAAEESGLAKLTELLNQFSLTAQPLVDPNTATTLRKIEEKVANERFAPRHSLSNYWRIDARKLPREVLTKLEEELHNLPGVDLVYREKTVSDPFMPENDPFAGLEKFLDPAPIGVDAKSAWAQPSGHGNGMRFIDLEQGWSPNEDVPLVAPLFNHNHDGKFGFVGDHGAAVLGIIAGIDNDVGVIGMATELESVRVVSHWNKHDIHNQNITGALTAAALADPPPHVILIEAQLGEPELPVETDPFIFDAIRLAVASGITVIEAAGNGNQDLDAWANGDSKHRLNRLDDDDFLDSGAIVVGAGTAKSPHNRSTWNPEQGSNFGSRVDCYAWGDSIVTAGYGDLQADASGKKRYTNTFGGTSGASAIIAGCALLVQGMHVQANGSPLSPEDMRKRLSCPGTGTAQDNAVAGNIGVMPDLQKIVTNPC